VFSGRSDQGPGPGRVLKAAAALLLATAFLSPGLGAKEATSRGRKADITWVEPDGTRVTVHARKIRFGYYRRLYLSVPKDGKSFKDDQHEERGVPMNDRLVRLGRTDRIEFTREETDDPDRPRLRITVTLANGNVVSAEGKELAGAYHPLSPYVTFTVDGVEKRIDLNPVGTAEAIAAQPRLELIRIVL